MIYRFIIKRTLRFLITVYIILTLVFVIFRFAGGSPASVLISGTFTEESKQRMLEQFGLTEPLHVQYITYMQNLLTGDFGISFQYQVPVWDIIIPALFNSLILTIPAMICVMLTAYYVGTLLGWKRGSNIEKIGSGLVILFRSTPHFVLGLLLLVTFSYTLDLFPTGGMVPISELSRNASLLENLTSITFYHHYVLPFATTYLYYLTNPTLLQRSNVIGQRNEDYAELLKLKGLTENRVRQHVAKNSMLPLLTWAATLVSATFGGVILIEVVFSWPGIGQLLVESLSQQDYPLAQAAFFLIAFFVLFSNLVIDLLYGYLDPRIKYGRNE